MKMFTEPHVINHGMENDTTEKEPPILSLIILNEDEQSSYSKELGQDSKLTFSVKAIQNLPRFLCGHFTKISPDIVEGNQRKKEINTQHVLQLLQQNYQIQLVDSSANNEENSSKFNEEQFETALADRFQERDKMHPSIPQMEQKGDWMAFDIHSADAKWIALLERFEYLPNEDRIRGYVEGGKKFRCLWETFQTSTISTFTVRSTDRFYEKTSSDDPNGIHGRILKGRALWKRKPLIPYDGVPFVQIDRKYFGCRLGGTERSNRFKGQFKTRRNGKSIKVGCQAEAEVLEVWRVSQLFVDPENVQSKKHRKLLKKVQLSKVHEYISKNNFTKRFYITFPLISKHCNHPILNEFAGKLKTLHPLIIEKIYQFVNEGTIEKNVIRSMLNKVVEQFQKEFDIEIKPYDRSFYPTDRDISNHIRNARKTKLDGKSNHKLENITGREKESVISENLLFNQNVEIQEIEISLEGNSNDINFINEERDFATEKVTEDENDLVKKLYKNDKVHCCNKDNVSVKGFDEIVETANFDINFDINFSKFHNDICLKSSNQTNFDSFINDTFSFKEKNCENSEVNRKRKCQTKTYSYDDISSKLVKTDDVDVNLTILLKEDIQRTLLSVNETLNKENNNGKLRTLLKTS